MEHVDDVIKDLVKQIELVEGSTKANHKVAKVGSWNRGCLERLSSAEGESW